MRTMLRGIFGEIAVSFYISSTRIALFFFFIFLSLKERDAYNISGELKISINVFFFFISRLITSDRY